MLQKILEKIESTPVTIGQWLMGFTGIIFIRYFFESISSTTNVGIVASDTFTLVHTWMYFIAILLGISCIIGYFTKDYSKAPKVMLFGLPIIWLGPLIDIFLSFGKGFEIAYIRDTGASIVRDFLTFFGPDFKFGATYGIRIEIAIVLVFIGVYVWHVRKNFFQSLLAVLASYIFIFVSFVIPGLLYTLSHLHNTVSTVPDVIYYLGNIILHSNIAHNTFRDGLSFVSLSRLVEMGFDKLFSQIFFVFSCVCGAFLFYKIDARKFHAVVKNVRLERVLFFLILLGFGMVYAWTLGYGHFTSYIDILTILCLVFTWISAWAYAVHLNDVADTAIDKISNPNRPLIQKVLSENDMREIGYLWLIVALIGAWSAGFTAFYMVMVYMFASYIYSVPPIRLRVLPLMSSFLISIACLVTVLAGFFFVSIDKRLLTFPVFISLGILIIFTLIINIKDLKDEEGDRADGVHTLPTMFGKNAGKAVGFCFALGMLLIPFFLSFYALYITAIPTAIIGYKIISKKPFRERSVFVLGFLFALSSIILFLSLHYIAGTTTAEISVI